MGFDAGLKLFNFDAVRVFGTAGIYYGPVAAQRGLVLDTGLTLGSGNTLSIDGLFEVGGNLHLRVNTRPASPRVEVAIENARVSILKAIEVEGAARILVATDLLGKPYLRIEGAFSGRLLGLVEIKASGFLDSRGYFGIDIDGRVNLGNDWFGIQAGGHLFIERSELVPLDFGADIYGRIRGFGITLLGAHIGVDYDGYGLNDHQTGRISAEAEVTVIGFSKSIGPFTLGYLRLPQSAVPTAPQLATLSGNTLLLNVGPRRLQRNVFNQDISETYTVESLGPGTSTGEKIRISAFGENQVFDNVTRVTGDFNDRDLDQDHNGNDQLTITANVGGSIRDSPSKRMAAVALTCWSINRLRGRPSAAARVMMCY